MADSFVADSFVPDAPAQGKEEKKPERREYTRRMDIRTPLDIMLHPQGTAETILGGALSIPLLGGAGSLATAAGLPAVVGKMAAGAGLGAARGAGEGRAFWDGLLDAAIIGVTEGVVGGAGKLIARGKAPLADALKAIEARLPTGKWLNVPTLDKAKLTVKEAVERLRALRGADYTQARGEVASEMTRLDMQKLTGPKPLAGSVFKERTGAKRSGLTDLAERVTGETGRTLAEAQAITPGPGDMPLGVYEGMGLAEVAGGGFGGVARHLLPHLVP